MPTKAAWIFGADQACLTAGVALFKLGDIHTTDSLDTLVTHQQKYVEILSKVRPHIVALARPRADRAVLSRTVLGPLHTQHTYLAAVRGTTRALQNLDLAAFQSATSRMRLAAKGLSRVSHGLKAYGAEACGWFFDPHGPKIHRLGNGGGSGTISA